MYIYCREMYIYCIYSTCILYMFVCPLWYTHTLYRMNPGAFLSLFEWKTLLASASRRGQSCQHWLSASLGNLPPLMTLSSSAGNGLAVDWSELAALLLNWTLCTSHCWWNLIQLPLCAENCGTLPYFQLVCVVWCVWSCSRWCLYHQGC
jgi:hypothetical protein